MTAPLLHFRVSAWPVRTFVDVAAENAREACGGVLYSRADLDRVLGIVHPYFPLVLWRPPCETFDDVYAAFCVVEIPSTYAAWMRRSVREAFAAGRAAKIAFDLLDQRGEQRAYCFVRGVLYGEMEFDYIVACGVAMQLTRPVGSWWERSWETHDTT